MKYFEDLLPNIELLWKEIYLTARKVTNNSHLHCFHYKVIENLLYLNKRLFRFGKTQSPFCSFIHTDAETTFYVSCKC